MSAAKGCGMSKLKFTLRLPKGSNSPIVLAAGGADGDGNGQIETEKEVEAFKHTAEQGVWVREQEVDAPTQGMLFAVTFTVGAGVPWRLTIDESGGKVLFEGASITVFPTETVSFFL
jgi:hypothetical protein